MSFDYVAPPPKSTRIVKVRFTRGSRIDPVPFDLNEYEPCAMTTLYERPNAGDAFGKSSREMQLEGQVAALTSQLERARADHAEAMAKVIAERDRLLGREVAD